MKKIRTYLLTLPFLCLSLASCNKDLPKEGEGQLKLAVQIQQDTKAAYTQEELLSNAIVNIYKADFSGLVRSYRYSQMPQSIYLPVDDYRVDVLAGELSKDSRGSFSWEQISYKGSQEFSITHGTVNNVSVTAKVCNIISEISFDPTIQANLNAGYTLKIGFDLAQQGQNATYTAEKSGKQLYMLTDDFEPTIYWEFSGVRSKNGAQISKSGMIESAQKGVVYKMTPKFVVKDGDADFDLVMEYNTTDIDDVIVFEPISSGLIESKPADIWATKAYIRAEVDESSFSEGTTVQFSYTVPGEEAVTIEAERLDIGSYRGLVSGLEPGSSFEYSLIIGGEQIGDPLTLTTAEAVQVPNPSFEVFSNAESSKYKSFYDPGHYLYNSKWWDNGNQGSTTVSASNAVCVPDNTNKVDGDYSAKCASQYVVIKFAAGSISSCEFAGTEGMSGGKVNFGRPFTGRPSAVSLWIKYNGGKTNRRDDSALAKGGVTGITADTPDRATFIAALGTWSKSKYGGSTSCPVQVNTTKVETLYKYDQLPETIAYGYFETESQPDWYNLVIPLQYYKTDEIPTHIILSFAASKYGDFFTGCDKATLWVDNVELLYE